MKIIKFQDKSYSWLQWPVTLKHCGKPTLHVTAKFFGQVPLNTLAVEAICKIYGAPPTHYFAWKPEIFGEIFHVLKFTTYPTSMGLLHHQFAIIKDQFEPYQPHITVPRDYWERVKNEGLTPESEEIYFHELELCLGEKDE